MSHDATGWAIKQRGLKPATKIVLWQLCDRFHPDNGCFPSQDTLAADCEMSRSSVNEHLAALEDAGLIRREQRRDGPTNRQKSTLYRFAFEAGFEAAKPAENRQMPCPESGHGAVSEKAPEPCPENDESRVQNPDTNLVREPVKEPEEREAREADLEKPEGMTRRAEGLFYRSFGVWDRFAVSPKKPMLDAWAKLTWAEMEAAADAVPRYLAAKKLAGMQHAPAISTYLDRAERLWEAFLPEVEKAKPAYAPAFGPVWAAIRMRDLVTGAKAEPSPLKGWEERAIADGKLDRATLEKGNLARAGWPMVNALHHAAETRGLGIHDYGPEEEQLGKLCEFVPLGGVVWEAWKAEHERRGWPWLPDPGSMRGVYFPAGGPDGLEAFEQALRGNHDAGGREAAE